MQPAVAVLGLVAGGGVLVLLLAVGLWARRRPARARLAPLWNVAEALEDLAFVLDRGGRIAGASAAARARYGEALFGRAIEEVLGPEAALLRRGVDRGPATARLALGAGAPSADAVIVRVARRPVRELLIVRPDRGPRPPPLPAPRPEAPREALRADLAALAAALRPPVERAATAAGLIRLSLATAEAQGAPDPRGFRPGEELARIEAELADLEQRLRFLQASGRELARRPGPVDLAALVSELVRRPRAGKARLRAQLAPARAWADPGRLRTALREVLRAAADALPASGELLVRVRVRRGNAVVELAPAAEGAEAAALARTLLVPEGGEVELDVPPGRAGVCRILLPGEMTPA